MISDKDRSGYFGASDTSYIIGNWKTKTFTNWWLVKLGLAQNNFTNESMLAGTNYEHKILDSLNIEGLEKDKQIIIGKLRVNLDGNSSDTIYEVKTYNSKKVFKVSKAYYTQVQVQMYATGFRKAFIVAYGLDEKDYRNYFNDIEQFRLSFHKIEYDEQFINNQYLPRLNYLSECLNKGVFPSEEVLTLG